jgi:transposase
MGSANFSSTHFQGKVLNILTVGIDLARSVFAVHGVSESGKPDFVRPEAQRAKLLELIAHRPSYLFGMEACSSIRLVSALIGGEQSVRP